MTRVYDRKKWVFELEQTTKDALELYLINKMGIIGEDLENFFNEKIVNVMGIVEEVDEIIETLEEGRGDFCVVALD